MYSSNALAVRSRKLTVAALRMIIVIDVNWIRKGVVRRVSMS
jgi:hypothetical protein